MVQPASFDELDIELNTFILLLGERKSGKTVLMRAIVDKLLSKYESEILGIWLYSNTAFVNANKDYNFTRHLHKPDAVHIKRHLIKQEQIKLLSIKDQRIKPKNVVIILDDWITDIKAGSREALVLEKLAAMGRHYNITVICLSQYWTKLSPTVRNNCSYVITTTVSKQQMDNVFLLQRDYKSKQLLWNDYSDFICKNEFSFMCIQKMNPRKKNIIWVEACPVVQFIDPEEESVIAEMNKLKFENDKREGDDTSNDESSLDNDLVE